VVYRALPKTVTATNRRHLLLRGRAARPCHGAALGLPHPEPARLPELVIEGCGTMNWVPA